MAERYSPVWIVQEIRQLHRQRLSEESGWLTKARIDEIERNLWDYWRSKRAAVKESDKPPSPPTTPDS